MSRIETSNTWEEGLVMDLNPLSTPNNVLTDCVNGTFITYNGNEFSLQNDQGNYKLEYCRLTPNYIPVGIKEYGDILYIVSHNPLDGSVEIGSYPSPLMITVPDEKHNNNDFDSIIDSQILDKGLAEGNYTELMENASNIIFNGEDYKLNPGDEYCLQTEGDRPPYKYETIEYHILDEDSNIHNITDKIKLDENGNPKDFSHVAWTVPGWLSIKARLAELSIAGINIRSFYVPKNNASTKTAHFAFNLRLNVNDSYLMRKLGDNPSILQDWCSKIDAKQLQDVRFRVFIEKENDGQFESVYNSEFIEFGITDVTSPIEIKKKSTSNFFLNEFDWTEWYGDSRVLWKNVSGKIEGLDADGKVRVRMIPVLFEEEYNYKIVYDNLEQSLLFDLSAVEDDEWDVGSELYQFYLSSDGNTQYIYTDITGPMISSFPVNLYYQIYDINGNALFKDVKTFEDYSGIGENVLQIPFDKNIFRKENIYVIQFKFAPSADEIGNFPTTTRFLISSEVFNDFTDVLVYDRDIKFDEWIKRYWAHNKTEFKLNYKDVDIEHPVGIVDEIIYENKLEGNVPTDSDIKYGITEDDSPKQYNTFFPDENSGLSDSIKYRKGFSYFLEYNTEVKEQSLEGDIWKGFAPKNELKMMDYSNNMKVPFSQYPLIDPEHPAYRTEIISSYVELLCKYHKMGLPFDFADVDFWYFSDNLEDLKVDGKILPNATGKLSEYMYNLSIVITGAKGADDNGENRSVSVKGNLLRSGNVSGYEYADYYDGKNEKHGFVPYHKIYEVLNDKKIPFLLVKIDYKLQGRTDNYELIQTISGGPNDGDITNDFTFHKESNTSFSLYYIAFKERTETMPVLVPLSISNGIEYFNNICKKLSIALKDVNGFTITDRYILNVESEIQYDPRLTIYNTGQFSNLIYKGHNLYSKQNRIDLVSILEKRFDSQINSSIFIDTQNDIADAMYDESFIVFDKVLAKVAFDSESFPYVSKNNNRGINEIRMQITKLSSKSDSDFLTWSNSSQINEGPPIKGLYCEDVLKSENVLLQEMNSGYLYRKDGNIYIYGKPFVLTEGITEKTFADKWKDSNKGIIKDTIFKNKAQWFCWHNWWNSGAESDNYIVLGGCLASDPYFRIDLKWKSWI